MGTVWSATQVATKRRVAIKFLLHANLASKQAQLRFEREIELSARMVHPSIARVFEAGQHEGVHFCVIELIEGRTLGRYIDEESPAQRRVISLMQEVCEAVQAAHQKGVIHRDLKPSNIMIRNDGTPCVLDFGLAKEAQDGLPDGGSDLSITGQIAGTPAYMAPEQASGQIHLIDARSDVYALGVILYEFTVGEHPHGKHLGQYELLKKIVEDEVTLPSELSRSISDDLKAILLKALDRDPDQRYTGAGQFAEDLLHLQRGEPVLARVPSATYLFRRWVQRHAIAVSLAVGVLTVLVGMATYSYFAIIGQRDRAVQAEQLANAETLRAQEAARREKEQAKRAREEADAVSEFILKFAENIKAANAYEGGDKDLRVAELMAANADWIRGLRPTTRIPLELELGKLTLNGGYWDEAETSFRSALSAYEDLVKPGTPTPQDLELKAAEIYYELSRVVFRKASHFPIYQGEAIALLEEAHRIRDTILGFDHPLTTLVRGDLISIGDISRDERDLRMARGLLPHVEGVKTPEDLILKLERVLGQARSFWQTGDENAAIQVVLDFVTPITANSTHLQKRSAEGILEVAHRQFDKEDIDGAKAVAWAAIAHAEKIYTKEPVRIAAAKRSVAWGMNQIKEYDTAADLYMQADRIYESRLGEHHPERLGVRGQRIVSLTRADRLEEAREAYELLRQVKDTLHLDRPADRIRFLLNLCWPTYLVDGIDATCALSSEAYRLACETYDSGTPDAASVLATHSRYLVKAERIQEAVELLDTEIGELKTSAPYAQELITDLEDQLAKYRVQLKESLNQLETVEASRGEHTTP